MSSIRKGVRQFTQFAACSILLAMALAPAQAAIDVTKMKFQAVHVEAQLPDFSLAGMTEEGLFYGEATLRQPDQVEKKRAAIYRLTADMKFELVWMANTRSYFTDLNDAGMGIGYVVNQSMDEMVPAIFKNGSIIPMVRNDGEMNFSFISAKGTIAGRFYPKYRYEVEEKPNRFIRLRTDGTIDYAPESLKGYMIGLTDNDDVIVSQSTQTGSSYNGPAVGSVAEVKPTSNYRVMIWRSDNSVIELGEGDPVAVSSNGAWICGNVQVAAKRSRGFGLRGNVRPTPEAVTWNHSGNALKLERTGLQESVATSINANGLLVGIADAYNRRYGTPFIHANGKTVPLTSSNIEGLPANGKLGYTAELTDRNAMLSLVEIKINGRTSYDTLFLVPKQ